MKLAGTGQRLDLLTGQCKNTVHFLYIYVNKKQELMYSNVFSDAIIKLENAKKQDWYSPIVFELNLYVNNTLYYFSESVCNFVIVDGDNLLVTMCNISEDEREKLKNTLTNNDFYLNLVLTNSYGEIKEQIKMDGIKFNKFIDTEMDYSHKDTDVILHFVAGWY